MHDIMHPKGACSESHDVFTFWEISDFVKVQDRDIVAMEHFECGNISETVPYSVVVTTDH